MADIFLLVNDEQHGPYEAGQLEAWLRDGSVEPETSAWQEGMAEWQPLAAFFPDAVPVPVPVPAPAPLPPQPVIRSPRPVVAPRPAVRPPRAMGHRPNASRGYYTPPAPVREGFNRLTYFLVILCSGVLLIGISALVSLFVMGALSGGTLARQDRDSLLLLASSVHIGVTVLWGGIAIWVGVKRLQNIGWPGWYVLVLLIPCLGLVAQGMLFALPPGFGSHRKMDAAGWGITSACVFVVLAIIGLGIGGFLETPLPSREAPKPVPLRQP